MDGLQPAEEIVKVFFLIRLESHFVVEIGPAGRHDECLELSSMGTGVAISIAGLLQAQCLDDIVADTLRGCRGKADHRDIWELMLEEVELLE